MTDGTTERVWLTYREAAARVRRTVREVNRWRADGMPMVCGIRDGQRVRLVDEEVLLGWWRDRMRASPVHYYRMRRNAREHGLPEPARPRSLDARTAPAVTTAPEPPADPRPDWDAIGHLRRGGDEWAALSVALENVRPACAGDPDYVADRVSPERAVAMATQCASCPLLELCSAFVRASRPAGGFWAGRAAS